MQYTKFIIEIERLKPHLDGLGTEVMEEAGLRDKPQYYNIISGKVRNPDVLQAVYDSAIKVIRGKINALTGAIQ